ncbi:MAG: ABC transporter permease [Clostridiales bacterium]|nr:ABC transporter permease [Clostridiales bacterium]
MNISENIRIAIFSIRTNLMRSALTMLGIIIGVSSVIAIITLGNGGKDYVINMLEDLSSNTGSIMLGTEATTSDFITDADVTAIKNIDGIEYCTPFVLSIGSASTNRTEGIAFAVAGTTDFQQVINIEIKEGRFFNNEEYLMGSSVCIMPNLSAQMMFGTENVVGKNIELTLNGVTAKLKIIGVSDMGMLDESTSSYSSMMPQSEGAEASAMLVLPVTLANRIMGTSDAYNMLYFTSVDPTRTESMGNAVQNILYARHGNFGSNAYIVSNISSYVDLLDRLIGLLTTFIAGVSGISLLVGGIGVMNIMLVSVTERTREIGIRKALGARTSTILLQFLTESIILCLIGGTVGFILGVGGAAAVAAYMGIPITIKFSTIAVAVGFSSAIGIFFGIYPARRAARMLPIEALRRD